MWRRVVIVAALAACGRSEPAAEDQPAASKPSAAKEPSAANEPPAVKQPPGATWTCEPLAFAESTPVPEASGAAWLTVDGQRALVVVSDSGNHGAYGIVDPTTGKTGEQGVLPLAGSMDDLEGAAGRDDKLYAITSPGWMLVWKRAGNGFELVDGPYALGPIDLPPKGGMGDKPPAGDGMICENHNSNCGRNYEGLCLAPVAARSACAGFAASKADGHLYCLTETPDGRFAIHRDRAIEIDRPGALADCAFDRDGNLWVGANLFGGGWVARVDGWQDPAHAKLQPVAQVFIGFSEVVTAEPDGADPGAWSVFRMSDTGGTPSLMAKFRCRAATR